MRFKRGPLMSKRNNADQSTISDFLNSVYLHVADEVEFRQHLLDRSFENNR